MGEDKTWTPSLDRVHGPLSWTGSMDPLSWTRSMDSFFIFIRRFCTRSMDTQNRNSAKKRFDETLSTNAHDWSQIFSCVYMKYTLLTHVQSQDCCIKLIQKLSPVQRLASPLEKQAGVKNSLLLEQSWLSHIAILHSWCSFSLSYNPCHFFFFEIWICKSLSVRIYNRPAKSAKELGPAWQNIAGKSDIHGQKESGLELFRSRMHFGEIKQPKTLLISRNEQLYILKEVENHYVCHDPSVWNKPQKFTFAQSKGFPLKHNLPIRENNSIAGTSSILAWGTNPPFFLHYVSAIKHYWSIKHCLLLLLFFNLIFALLLFLFISHYWKNLSMDPVHDRGSMDPWSMFCSHPVQKGHGETKYWAPPSAARKLVWIKANPF